MAEPIKIDKYATAFLAVIPVEHLICVKHEQKLDNPQMLELTQSQQGLADPSRYGHFQVNTLGIQLNVLGKAARRIQLLQILQSLHYQAWRFTYQFKHGTSYLGRSRWAYGVPQPPVLDALA